MKVEVAPNVKEEQNVLQKNKRSVWDKIASV